MGGEASAPVLPKRPSVALALGGGAARGFAHIGVLRALVANGITPDIIVGTSIGAVAGGCFAGGAPDVERLGRFGRWAGDGPRPHAGAGRRPGTGAASAQAPDADGRGGFPDRLHVSRHLPRG